MDRLRRDRVGFQARCPPARAGSGGGAPHPLEWPASPGSARRVQDGSQGAAGPERGWLPMGSAVYLRWGPNPRTRGGGMARARRVLVLLGLELLFLEAGRAAAVENPAWE